MFSDADEHVTLIRNLAEPSIIAVASVSQTVLKTARSLLASAVERRHSFRDVLVRPKQRTELRGVDVVFCDSLAIRAIRCGQKVHYQLIKEKSMAEIAAIGELGAFPKIGRNTRR
jgi:hypothetical protein